MFYFKINYRNCPKKQKVVIGGCGLLNIVCLSFKLPLVFRVCLAIWNTKNNMWHLFVFCVCFHTLETGKWKAVYNSFISIFRTCIIKCVTKNEKTVYTQIVIISVCLILILICGEKTSNIIQYLILTVCIHFIKLYSVQDTNNIMQYLIKTVLRRKKLFVSTNPTVPIFVPILNIFGWCSWTILEQIKTFGTLCIFHALKPTFLSLHLYIFIFHINTCW